MMLALRGDPADFYVLPAKEWRSAAMMAAPWPQGAWLAGTRIDRVDGNALSQFRGGRMTANRRAIALPYRSAGSVAQNSGRVCDGHRASDLNAVSALRPVRISAGSWAGWLASDANTLPNAIDPSGFIPTSAAGGRRLGRGVGDRPDRHERQAVPRRDPRRDVRFHIDRKRTGGSEQRGLFSGRWRRCGPAR